MPNHHHGKKKQKKTAHDKDTQFSTRINKFANDTITTIDESTQKQFEIEVEIQDPVPPVVEEPIITPSPTPVPPVVEEPIVTPSPTPVPPVVEEPIITPSPTPVPPVVEERVPSPTPAPVLTVIIEENSQAPVIKESDSIPETATRQPSETQTQPNPNYLSKIINVIYKKIFGKNEKNVKIVPITTNPFKKPTYTVSNANANTRLVPPVVKNLLFNLDGSSISNFTFYSDKNVASWIDLIGNCNFDSVIGNGGQYISYDSKNKCIVCPSFTQNVIGELGMNAILVNNSTLINNLQLTNGGTIYCVCNIPSNNTTYGIAPFGIANTTSSNGLLYGFGDTKTVYIDTLASNRDGPKIVSPPNGGQTLSTKHIMKISVSSSNVYTYSYITSINPSGTFGCSFSYNGNRRGVKNPMYVGGAYAVSNGNILGANTFIGNIYQILFYNSSLSQSEEESIESFLISKWRL